MVSTISRPPLRNGFWAFLPAHILENATQATPLGACHLPNHPEQCCRGQIHHPRSKFGCFGYTLCGYIPGIRAVQRLCHSTLCSHFAHCLSTLPSPIAHHPGSLLCHARHAHARIDYALLHPMHQKNANCTPSYSVGCMQ